MSSRELDRRPGPSVRVQVHEVTEGRRRRHEDRLATEEPLEIRLAWPGRAVERLAVTMRTPGHDFELAAGFLHAEGLLAGAADLHTIGYCTDVRLDPEQQFNVVTVELGAPPPRLPADRYAGPGAGSAACGVCGKQSIADALHHHGPAAGSTWPEPVPRSVVHRLPAALHAAQRVFAATGGLHAAGLFGTDGSLLAVREDIGRHNAVDKVIGSRLLAGDPAGAPVLCLSGRIGFELVQKAAAAGVGVVAAVGAPSSLAVRFAEDTGLCLAGFVREDRFVLYSRPDRVTD